MVSVSDHPDFIEARRLYDNAVMHLQSRDTNNNLAGFKALREVDDADHFCSLTLTRILGIDETRTVRRRLQTRKWFMDSIDFYASKISIKSQLMGACFVIAIRRLVTDKEYEGEVSMSSSVLSKDPMLLRPWFDELFALVCELQFINASISTSEEESGSEGLGDLILNKQNVSDSFIQKLKAFAKLWVEDL